METFLKKGGDQHHFTRSNTFVEGLGQPFHGWQDAKSAFRVAQTRQLGADEKPGQDTVWRFSQCVLAEIETLQLLNGASSTGATGSLTSQLQESGQVAAKVKALELKTKGQGKGTPGQVGKLCNFLGSKEGCKAGHCKYQHDWNNIQDKQGRCWNCSSTTHMRSECPALRTEGLPRTSTGGSGDLRDGQKGKSKGKKGGKKTDSKDKEDRMTKKGLKIVNKNNQQ